jgi:hypothetical protein
MQATLFGALNSIAYSAQQGTYNNGVPDLDAMSAVQDAYQNLFRQLGTQYDAAAASYTTTNVVQPQATEFSVAGVPGSWDAQQQWANANSTPNVRLIGG